MTDYTVADLVGATLEKSPDKFKEVFDDVMGNKIAAALEVKRQEVAQNFMSDEQEESSDENESTEVTNEE